MHPMRVAWFSPMPPVRSGIAAYTAEVVPLLRRRFTIDLYGESNARDFVYAHQRAPYALTVYQLGNGRAHDFMWGYLARYPGLTVLHDARLHHARARMLLAAGRLADYRQEFRYCHPDAPAGASEYAIEGLGGLVHYLWPMLRVAVATARSVAVHSDAVAREIAGAYPGVHVEQITMGVPAPAADEAASRAIRQRFCIGESDILFAAFGTVTPEKRIEAAMEAMRRLDDPRVHLLIAGAADDEAALESRIAHAGLAGCVHIAGYVRDGDISNYLAAADACLCLRWPTALETSASWLRCIAAGRPTILSDLVHLADVPRSVALRVDVLDETRTLEEAMRTLAADAALRGRLGEAARAFWRAGHTLGRMAEDYIRAIETAAGRAAPGVAGLPGHLVDDHGEPARAIARHLGVDVDVLSAR
jgi:glycosyltransferase involved in cell wall biosynthesis